MTAAAIASARGGPIFTGEGGARAAKSHTFLAQTKLARNASRCMMGAWFAKQSNTTRSKKEKDRGAWNRLGQG